MRTKSAKLGGRLINWKMPAIITGTVLILILAVAIPLSIHIAKSAKMIRIVEAKMAKSVDEKLIPEGVTNIFPQGTAKVTCWLRWENGKIGSQLAAKWYFITDDIAIYDYRFTIPRKAGYGSVSLAMPGESTLPQGLYRVDLLMDNHRVKSVNFTVE